MNCEFSSKDSENRKLTGMIARMTDEAPPADFTQKVMQHIRPKRISAWQRLRIRLLTPLAIISVRPLPAVAAATALAGLIVAFNTLWFTHTGSLPGKGTVAGAEPVNFVLDFPSARKVAVIGSFNHWQPENYQMHRDRNDGTWRLTIELQPGRHAYAFIVDDDRIIADPRALWEQDDGFGTRNSIITIQNGNSDENRNRI